MKKVKELRLDYCDECEEMTNHLDDECQKCKAKENKTSRYENYDEDEDYHKSNHRRKRGGFEDEDY